MTLVILKQKSNEIQRKLEFQIKIDTEIEYGISLTHFYNFFQNH